MIEMAMMTLEPYLHIGILSESLLWIILERLPLSALLPISKLATHKETIDAPFYRQQSFSTAYQELNLALKNGFGIILRAYDEGVAYRFYTQRGGKTIILNGKKVTAQVTEDGYYTINRKWKKGDVVRIHFDMEARTVRANNKVEADRGCISIERGPIVYCAEWPDNNFDIMSLLENQNPEFTEGKMAYDAFISKDYKNVLSLYKGQNLETLSENVQSLAFDKSGKLTTKDETLKLIPYFAWAHRGNGNMKVWLPQDVKAARPSAPATQASQAKVEFSSPVPAKSSITDGLVPADENDRSIPYCHWWPKKNTTEWITYTFPEAKEIKTSTVYWYDDQSWGGCKVPDSWKIYYQDEAGNWKEVTGADGYPTNRGVASTVNFDPVKTKAVKLELKQPETHSCGLFEWSVK